MHEVCSLEFHSMNYMCSTYFWRTETATKGGEWEPQISFEIFGHCPKIKPQRQTHERWVVHETTRWLDVYGDDQETHRDPLETTKPSPRRNALKLRRLHRAGMSTGQVRTVRGRGSGMSAVCGTELPKIAKNTNLPDLRPNQNQLPPKLNQGITRQ